MSLIIASNVNLNDAPNTSDIHKPYSWSNRLSNTMKIPANSEIAVQSVKINKSGELSVGANNSNFCLHIGQDVGDGVTTLDDSVSHPVYDSIKTDLTEMTTDELKTATQIALSKNLMSPLYYKAGKADVILTAKTGAGGGFEGFDFTFNQNAERVKRIPKDTETQSLFPTSRFTYSGGELERVTATPPETNGSAPQGCAVLFPGAPVILGATDAFPSIEFDISDGTGADTGKWGVGLSRNITQNPLISPETGATEMFAPPYYDARRAVGQTGENFFAKGYFDYVALRDNADLLRIYQSCVSTNQASGDHLVMREVVYYGNHNKNFPAPHNLSTNPGDFTHIRFIVNGDKVECGISKGGGAGNYGDLVKNGMKEGVYEAQKDNVFYPRTILKNFLYPTIFMIKLDRTISITDLNTYKELDIDDPLLPAYDLNDKNLDFVNRLNSTNKYVTWGKPIDNRSFNDSNPTRSPTTEATIYRDAYPYNGAGTTGGYIEDNQVNMILAPNDNYGIGYTNRCNTQNLLGFKGRSLVRGTFGATGQTTFSSVSPPLLTSPKSLFVRLNNFTQNSVNAQLGNAYSKLIAHLPRFDSAGNEVGGLFFEPHELVYIALNNPADMYMNTIDIDLVYDNESYARCLSGKSIVCLHLRTIK